MPALVVHGLEVVDVDEQGHQIAVGGTLAVGAPPQAERQVGLERVLEQAAIAETGELVGSRQVGQPAVDRLQFATTQQEAAEHEGKGDEGGRKPQARRSLLAELQVLLGPLASQGLELQLPSFGFVTAVEGVEAARALLVEDAVAE